MTLRIRAAVGGLAVLLAAAGCGGKKPVVETDGPVVPREAENPWPKAVAALRKETDSANCRRVLAELTTSLSGVANGLPALSETELTAVQAALALSDDERKEVAPSGFTNLDGAYLAECFCLRDAANSINVSGQPAEAKATAAFAWLCRQVQLDPRTIPAPPTYVLRRGSGSVLDRATVFLALGRQLDLDVCLVGPPAAQNWPKGGDADSARVPFWAVGVRDGSTVLLFDPVRGVPFPGPTPGKPATLAELKANPDLLKPWAADGKAAVPTADEIKAAELFLAVPVSAVSARMAAFDKAARTELGVRTAVDVAAAKAAFAPTGTAARVWANAKFDFAPSRVLRQYLPVAEGGAAEVGPQSPFGLYIRQQLPPVVTPPGLAPNSGVAQSFRQLSIGLYVRLFLENSPRERLQRGQFSDAALALVRTRDEFRHIAERGGDAAAVAGWAERMNDAYRRKEAAALDANDPKVQAELQKIQQEIDKGWQDKAVGSMLSVSIADPVVSEATYLLALTKHEQAEREQTALARATDANRAALTKAAADAWAEAKGWWDRYAPLAVAQEATHPGRTAHAKALAARAATFQ